jgi:hypothetical protein
LKILLVTVAVLVALLVAGDLFVKNMAENRAETQIQQTLGLDESPSVDLGGFPFVIRAVTGGFGDVEVTADDLTVEGVRLDRVEVLMRDVEISLGKLLGGDTESVKTGGGEGEASMSERDLRRALRQQGVDARIRLNDDGSVTIDDPRLPTSLSGEIVLEGREIVITATDAPAAYSITLPKLIDGLVYEELSVEASSVVVSFSLSDGVFRAPT